jgi:hypothetical protein
MATAKLAKKTATIEMNCSIKEMSDILKIADKTDMTVDELMITAFHFYADAQQNPGGVHGIISDLNDKYGSGGIPYEKVLRIALDSGISEEKLKSEIKRLKGEGEIFEPKVGYYSTT